MVNSSSLSSLNRTSQAQNKRNLVCRQEETDMMMIGEGNYHRPTVDVSPWTLFDDSSAVGGMNFSLPVSGVSANGNVGGGGTASEGDYSSFLFGETIAALQRYLPSNDIDADSDLPGREADLPLGPFSTDEFRMYEFKVRRCARGRSHDWTECPYAHPGEKARRRDPRKFHYSGTACPDFRKGNCTRGDSCEFAHGVFECWLHPARYRTQPCKDGTNCRRRVCFFAHTAEQLRVLPQQSPRTPVSADSFDGSPLRHSFDSYLAKNGLLSSPTSTLISPPLSPPSDSPPMSPSSPLSRSFGSNSVNEFMSPSSPLSRSFGSNSVNEVVASMRHLQLNKAKSSPSSWGVQMGCGFGSPRVGSTLRPGFYSLPSTPTQAPTRGGTSYLDIWERGCGVEEEPPMERVESGRDLRAKLFEKLSKENSLERVDSPSSAPDVGWVSELVK
ncbi:zinc finger CCCH domain-containing protein 20-like [Telopea speciosissima]|uniref:zinc finger CCCH domain-containing protein 20-like n=1 Tax=Telopea speciosissima TaxID=54955 RepID=UPI001CC7C647|nr:zinc finger CCCH domain-containing protein 20-like [Telopea speciosissima]